MFYLYLVWIYFHLIFQFVLVISRGRAGVNQCMVKTVNIHQPKIDVVSLTARTIGTERQKEYWKVQSWWS